jgi:hypothetical protein
MISALWYQTVSNGPDTDRPKKLKERSSAAVEELLKNKPNQQVAVVQAEIETGDSAGIGSEELVD